MPNAVLNPLKFRAAVFDTINSENTGFSNYSYWRSTIRTFFKNKAVVVLVALVFAMIVMSIFYPIFSDVDPRQSVSFRWTGTCARARNTGLEQTPLGVTFGPAPGMAAEIPSCWASALPFQTWGSA